MEKKICYIIEQWKESCNDHKNAYFTCEGFELLRFHKDQFHSSISFWKASLKSKFHFHSWCFWYRVDLLDFLAESLVFFWSKEGWRWTFRQLNVPMFRPRQDNYYEDVLPESRRLWHCRLRKHHDHVVWQESRVQGSEQNFFLKTVSYTKKLEPELTTHERRKMSQVTNLVKNILYKGV